MVMQNRLFVEKGLFQFHEIGKGTLAWGEGEAVGARLLMGSAFKAKGYVASVYIKKVGTEVPTF